MVLMTTTEFGSCSILETDSARLLGRSERMILFSILGPDNFSSSFEVDVFLISPLNFLNWILVGKVPDLVGTVIIGVMDIDDSPDYDSLSFAVSAAHTDTTDQVLANAPFEKPVVQTLVLY